MGIIQAAFSEGRYWLPPDLRRELERGSAHVDNDQSQEGSFKHGMRTPKQSSKEAETLMNQFIEQKVREYKELLSQGKDKEAYFRLGEAMHPIMDSTSPSHKGFQIWNGFFKSPIEVFRHHRGESQKVFNSNPEYLRKNVELLRGLYDYSNK